METVNQGAPILVGGFHDLVWIRIEGKGDFMNSPELKEFAIRMVDRGQSNIVVDLEMCPTMDSTFMGTLTGIALRVKAKHSGKLQVVNANTRNQQLLESLGLDLIFDLDTDGSAWSRERALVRENLEAPEPTPQLDKKERAKFVLKAHEDLCRANKDNVRRFKNVIEFLRNDVEETDS
ncbi:MAG: STAS domain-containing protein [Myxococcota bacterium]